MVSNEDGDPEISGEIQSMNIQQATDVTNLINNGKKNLGDLECHKVVRFQIEGANKLTKERISSHLFFVTTTR